MDYYKQGDGSVCVRSNEFEQDHRPGVRSRWAGTAWNDIDGAVNSGMRQARAIRGLSG
jgi:hypothetical protein